MNEPQSPRSGSEREDRRARCPEPGWYARIRNDNEHLDSAERVITNVALRIEQRDRYTDGHCQRLAAYATALGERLKLNEGDIAILHQGGLLHDLGKIAIPDAVLLKPQRLSPAEYEIMKQHTVIGDALCAELQTLRALRPIVRHHHERLDGSGYPDGLQGTHIPLLAQIIAIVDIYDALTTARPYKSALPPAHAFDELRKEAARGWRRLDLIEVFVAVIRAKADLVAPKTGHDLQ